jgi:hypothetical protein
VSLDNRRMPTGLRKKFGPELAALARKWRVAPANPIPDRGTTGRGVMLNA